MPTQESEDILRRLKQAQQIDERRDGADPFRLAKQLRADLDADATLLEQTDLAMSSTRGDMRQATGTRRGAMTELERQLRGGFRFLQGIDEGAITEEERSKVYETYGWAGGEIGRFDDDRVVSLARTALSIGAGEIPQAEWRYPQARLDRIILQLGIVTGNAVTATGGDREQATKLRDAALETARTTLARVRFHYCSASRDADKTPELAKLDFQPRRMPGKAEKRSATDETKNSSSVATPVTAGS